MRVDLKIKRVFDAAAAPLELAGMDGGVDQARPDVKHTMTRRALVGAAPAAFAAAHLPTVAFGKHPDAELLALGEPYEHTLAAIKSLGSAYARAEERFFAQREDSCLDEDALRTLTGVDCAEDAYHSALDQSSLVIDRIVGMPARTVRGLAFKAMVSRRECNGLPELIDSIVADLIAAGSYES